MVKIDSGGHAPLIAYIDEKIGLPFDLLQNIQEVGTFDNHRSFPIDALADQAIDFIEHPFLRLATVDQIEV